MSDEGKGTVTDEALSQAQDEAEGKTQETETAPEEKVETKEADVLSVLQKQVNDLKAEMGRGGKALSEVTAMKKEIADLSAIIKSQQTQHQQVQDSEQYVATVQDVKKVLSDYEREKQANYQAYENSYLNSVAQLAINEGLTDEQMDELDNLLKTSIQGSKTNYTQPTLDAEINFNKAMRLLGTPKKVNLKGDKAVGTGIGSPTKNAEPKNADIKLDPEALAYAEAVGLTPEQIQGALKGDTPMRLKR